MELPVETHGRIIKNPHGTSFETKIPRKASDLKVFISYSMEDKEVGAKIKRILEDLGIKSFMAHEDIEVSEEWKQRILTELKEADIFIPILSDDFRNSDWCSQEAGIASYRGILIIPLSIDEIKPYGFMSHRQGKPIHRRTIPSEYLLKPIIDNFPEIDILDLFINELKESRSFSKAQKAMKKLEPCFDKLNQEQINKVITASIKNDQIWQSFQCRDIYLPKFIEINEDKIDKNKLNKLLNLIED